MVPTKIFICVTPDEKILGSNFLKKNFNFLSIFTLNENFGKYYFLVKNTKNINCKIPAAVTAYDK